MNTDEARTTLRKELEMISQMKVLQSEKSQLVYDALEKYRQAGNKIRRAEQAEERKRIQPIFEKFRAEKKDKDYESNKKTLQAVAGTELFDSFVKKFTKEEKNER